MQKRLLSKKKRFGLTDGEARSLFYEIKPADGNQWIASGVLEWARRNLYSDIINDVYEVMSFDVSQ